MDHVRLVDRVTWASLGAIGGACLLVGFLRAWDAVNDWLAGR